jgi:glyoxylase-like metal-dependent hydrolase (beta-lactamase superfamily II)
VFQPNVAEGVHRVEDAFVNWYLVEEDGRLLAVDAGLPSSWDSLHDAVRALGRSASDLEAVVLTHAHFDHVGFAERARSELGIDVWVHEADAELTRHPLRYSYERLPVLYAWRPSVLRIFGSLLASGALWAPRIAEVRTFGGEETLPLPGSPRLVPTPGHTFGHCALHLPDRDVLLAGDAVVTLNPYTAGRGPQLVARAATADSGQALASLDAIERTGAEVVLTGHGEPWRQGAEALASRARAAGIS